MIIDSHAHYSHHRFDGTFTYLRSGENGYTVVQGDRESLLQNLDGISLVLEPGIGFESNELTAALYQKYPQLLRLAVGVHPTRVARAPWRKRKQLEQWAVGPGVVAIGETGLDYHHPKGQRRLLQWLWFSYQLRLAHRLSLPLVLHIRMADRDALAMLRRRRHMLHGGVVHCFQGDWQTAQQYLDLGFCLGIGGALLQEQSRALQEAVAQAPLERLLLETDSPYVLPDFPWPGSGKARKRLCNSSLILSQVLQRIAELKGVSPALAEETIYQNTLRAFHLEPPATEE